MTDEKTTLFEQFVSDPENRRLLERELLSLEATEAIAGLMSKGGISKTALAERLQSSKAHVSQLLSGSRNMTLHTLSDLLFALGHKARIDFVPLEPRSVGMTNYEIGGNRWSLYTSRQWARKADEPSLEQPNDTAAA